MSLIFALSIDADPSKCSDRYQVGSERWRQCIEDLSRTARDAAESYSDYMQWLPIVFVVVGIGISLIFSLLFFRRMRTAWSGYQTTVGQRAPHADPVSPVEPPVEQGLSPTQGSISADELGRQQQRSGFLGWLRHKRRDEYGYIDQQRSK